MAPFAVGDHVYVPVERVAPGANTQYALAKGRVTAVNNRTLTLSLTFLPDPVNVASSAVHKDVGVCVIRIGDLATEDTLLDPIGKSVLQYLRLLVPDDQVKYVALRTTAELYQIYETLAPAYTHFVLIGHGSDDGSLVFACGEREASVDLASKLQTRFGDPRMFISLCCHTGKANFGKPFSRNASCKALIAPFGLLHGAVASQFLQTFFAYHFLEGKTFKVAFKNARVNVPWGATFRIWENGNFEGAKQRSTPRPPEH